LVGQQTQNKELRDVSDGQIEDIVCVCVYITLGVSVKETYREVLHTPGNVLLMLLYTVCVEHVYDARTHAHAHTHAHTHTHAQTHAHTHTHACTRARTHARTRTHSRTEKGEPQTDNAVKVSICHQFQHKNRFC